MCNLWLILECQDSLEGENMANIGVIGAGSWGIALASLLYHQGNSVAVWSAIETEIEMLSRTRRLGTLPGLKLPEDMTFTADLEKAMKGKELLVLAVPSIYVRQTAKRMCSFCKEGQILVNVAKGIEDKSLMTLSSVIEEELPMAEVTVLSGPSHAEEVSRYAGHGAQRVGGKEHAPARMNH